MTTSPPADRTGISRSSAPRLLALRFRPDLALLPLARRAVSGSLAAAPGAPLPADAELVTTELVSNAIQASPPDAEIDLTLRELAPGRIEIRVRNRTTTVGLPVIPDEVAINSVRGRGLLLVDRLAERFELTRHGSTVTASALLAAGGG